MLPAAAMRALRLVGCVCTFAHRLRLGARAPGAERSGAAPQTQRRLRPCPTTTWRRSGRRRRSTAGVRHQRDAAVARNRRPLLVRLPDARRPTVLPRRSGEEGEGAALRSREDGGRADDRSRACPTTRSTCRSRRCGSSRRTRPSSSTSRCRRPRSSPDEAARDDDRAGAAGRRPRAATRIAVQQTDAAADRPARRAGARGAGRGSAGAAAQQDPHFEYDMATAR